MFYLNLFCIDAKADTIAFTIFISICLILINTHLIAFNVFAAIPLLNFNSDKL